nr:immunoglobulin light chain junction region [Macaca mulatta]
CLVLYGGAVLF